MILVITGNGKGKTTSAIGTALRACGWKKKVAIVFFDKGGSHYGEQNILEILQGKIDVFRYGLKRFNEDKKKFRFKNTEGDKIEARNALQKVRDLYNKDYYLIVCDEIINVLNLGLIDEFDFKTLIDDKPKDVHLILTGRNAPDWLVYKSDLVSEVNEIKHYFRNGKQAIKGLDF